MACVYALLTKSGVVSSINATLELAEAKRDRFNADPFLASGVNDPAAPYTVESWRVDDGDAALVRRAG